ncbi:MAG TPA: lysophospholipid acyltransferase family protein [Candidatus Bathyarchaeia archaeon]|nr:lysophospholipid acyltransferase family protein [Candidatus Bathyarchaeia archaeon]
MTVPGGAASLPSPRPRRHHRPLSPLRSRLEYEAVSVLLAGLRALPEARARELMAGIVERASRLSPRLWRIGTENLRRAFPERDAAWCEATLGASFRNLGRLAGEVAHLDSLRPGNIRERIGFLSPEDEERWQQRMNDSRGTVIATGHFGNWELFAQAQGLLGHPIHIVHRPLKNPLLDDLINRLRSRAGTGVIYKHAAAREMLRLLRSGHLVAIPIDQHAPGASGIAVPFFGRPASTTPGLARLAQLTGAPIHVAVLVRCPDMSRHSIMVGPAIEVTRTRDRDADLVATMTRVNAAFEAVVRAYPEQWLWMHRRWRLD